MIPSVIIEKRDRQTGVVRPSSTGVLAIVGPCSRGPLNLAGGFTDARLALEEYGPGPLVSYATTFLQLARLPVVLVRSETTDPGSIDAVVIEGGGTATATTTGEPYADYDVVVRFVSDGIIGAADPPLKYQVSLDGGQNFGSRFALGVGKEIHIAAVGLLFVFTDGTILGGETVSARTWGPDSESAAIDAALEGLRVSSSVWESLLICVSVETPFTDRPSKNVGVTVEQVSTWLLGLAEKGRYRTALMSLRMKAPFEPESVYREAARRATWRSVSNDIVVGADGGIIWDPLVGAMVVRPTALFVAARGMSNGDPSEDVAYVGRGPIVGVQIADTRGNALFHDEALFPGLDDLRLATLRSFNGKDGVFINNAPILSANGSDFVYWQHARICNIACEVAYALLTEQLSKGVEKSTKKGPNGERYISEESAQLIEGLVDAGLKSQLRGRTSDVQCVLSRTDDISSNAGAVIHAKVEIVSLAYIKEFAVSVGYVVSLSGGVQS